MSDPIRAQLPTGGASIVTDTLAAARARMRAEP